MKNDHPGSEFSLLIGAILKHLVLHPDAKDSVEGIYNYWLADRNHQWSREKVHEALDCLVDEEKWLTRKLSGAAVPLYGLDKHFLAEVRDYLRRSGDAD